MTANNEELAFSDVGLTCEWTCFTRSRFYFSTNIFKERCKPLEIGAFRLVGDFFGSANLNPGANVAKLGHIVRQPKFIGQSLVAEFSAGSSESARSPCFIKVGKHRPRTVQFPKPVESDRIEAFENIKAFPVSRRMTMLFLEALNVLETGNNARLLRRTFGNGLLGIVEPQFRGEFVVVEIRHTRLPCDSGHRQRHLRPAFAPIDLALSVPASGRFDV